MWYRSVLFLALNFGALALGNLLMGDPMNNEWYQESNKAPWTPPGWVFGAAWFVVMACFSFFMGRVTEQPSDRGKWIFLYVLQLLLNVGWNPIFFQFHLKAMGLVILVLLLMVLLIMAAAANRQGNRTLALLPYILWMLVAISLNGYILFNN
jgi:tryptophan-rich sensory protein